MAIRLLVDERATYDVADEPVDTSFTKAPNDLLNRKDVSGGAKLTYIILLQHAWQSDECYPSHRVIGEKIGATRQTVMTNLQELEGLGLIEVIKRKGRSTVYRPRKHPFLIEKPVKNSDRYEGQPVKEFNTTCQKIRQPPVKNFDTEEDSVKKTQEEDDDDVARVRKIDEPIRRVLAAFGMTEAPWSVNAISERLARYEETYPGLDAVAEAEAMRSESDAEGRRHGNWLARWDGWMRTAWQRRERVRQTAPPQSTPPPVINPNVPLDFASVPAELMPDAHRDVPHYMDLMDKALRWYVEEKGKTQWPHQYGVFRCAPAKEQCDASRMVLVTNEPPDAASEMEQFVRILARGFDVRVESRWAS